MVIQRWQTVMLLISCIMMGIFSFISLGQIQSADYTFDITSLGIFREGIATAPGEPTGLSTIYLFIDSVLSFVLPLIGIFCFKNMKLQKNLIIFSILTLATAGVLAVMAASSFASDVNGSVQWSVFIATPVVALVADLLAYRMICSDQKKLRAADRLR
ncbi:MAG: DUF4293 domain-containing protein [Muribaculum sp.]|nr:DUF4293 domain-containing protein [Muribaculum sp.]